MQLLLKFKDSKPFENAGQVRQFFDTTANQPSEYLTQQPTVSLILDKGKVYLNLDPSHLSEYELIEVNKELFNKKIKANELRFWFDQNNMVLTLARSIAAGVMTQTHSSNLTEDLVALEADTNFPALLQENFREGLVYVFPIAIGVYLVLQYVSYYYKTGQWLSYNDLKFQQMVRDSFILGVQSLFICISFAIARASIPLLLNTLNFMPAGIFAHFMIALMFGLIFASSLLIYDLCSRTTGYGQLTTSPGIRFVKNLSIGIGLYFIQLIPGLGSLNEWEQITRASLAFLVPNTVNYTARYLPSWRSISQVKPHVPELDDQHDMTTSLTVR